MKWKKVALAVTAALTGGVIAMALLGHKVVHTEIVVPAPPQAVWAVLTDPAGYAEWNPILVRAEGEYRAGQQIRYRMRDEAGKESDITSTVIALDPPRAIEQFGGMRGVLTFEHRWRLEPVEGGTRVVQHEAYRGIGVWFWNPSGVERQYRQANEALRARVLKTQAAGQPAAEP